jgi:hypothetical protein
MPEEALIHLEVEDEDGVLFVSSPEFPLLQLAIHHDSEIESLVLPVLKEIVEDEVGTAVRLRVIRSFDSRAQKRAHVSRSPHVIAAAA